MGELLLSASRPHAGAGKPSLSLRLLAGKTSSHLAQLGGSVEDPRPFQGAARSEAEGGSTELLGGVMERRLMPSPYSWQQSIAYPLRVVTVADQFLLQDPVFHLGADCQEDGDQDCRQESPS